MTRWEKQMFEASFTPGEIKKLASTKSYYAGTCGGVDLYLKRGWVYRVKAIVAKHNDKFNLKGGGNE